MKILECRDSNVEATKRYLQKLGPLPTTQKLDLSLKKNSTMANKLKSVNAETAPKLIDELQKLNFEKFIAEFVSSMVECAAKMRNSADIMGFLQVASVLHQRSSDFSQPFLSALVKAVLPYSAQKSTSESMLIRAIMRVLSEFMRNGFVDITTVFTGKHPLININATGINKDIIGEEGGIIYFILSQYLNDESTDNSYLALSFAKFCADDYLNDCNHAVVAAQVRSLMNELFKKYYERYKSELITEHKLYLKAKSYSDDQQMMRGNLNDQQKTRLETLQEKRDSLMKIVSNLSESLKLQMPELSQEDVDDRSLAGGAIVVNANAKFITAEEEREWWLTPWEDWETCQFYCDVPDLINYVNPQLLNLSSTGNKKKKKNLRKQKKNDEDDDWWQEFDEEFYDQVDDDLIEYAEQNVENEDETSGQSKGPSVNVHIDNILTSLPNMINKKLLDQAVLDFCNALPGCREEAIARLSSLMISVPRFRTDILPYYARFVATLNKYIPELGNTIVACLLLEFKRRYRRMGQFNQEHRSKNIRFLGELLKFGVCPTHVIFYCFKRLTQPEASGSMFTANHITIAANLLETCGRYMSKIPEIAKKWNPLVEIFEKKCKSFVLDTHVKIVVENALLTANPQPPDPNQGTHLELLKTPLEHFVNYLIHKKLSKISAVKEVVDLIRCLPWNEKNLEMELFQPTHNQKSSEAQEKVKIDVFEILLNKFTSPWLLRFNQLPLLASCLSLLLQSPHSSFAVAVVDDVLEEIRFGMLELTHFQHQQRRISLIRYLGELFNARIVRRQVIFDTLYLLVLFGHPSGLPQQSSYCPIDPPNDFFRIKLIAELLDSCNNFLYKARSEMEDFLIYYQYYILTKTANDMPVDVKFAVEDIFSKIRPDLIRFTTIQEASQAVNNLRNQFPFLHARDENDQQRSKNQEVVEKVDDENMEVDNFLEEEAFAKEFQSMVTDSIASRKSEKKQLDVSVPTAIKFPQSDQSVPAQKESNTVKFRVLTKGKVANKATIEIPVSSSLVTSTRSHQEEERKEKAQIKNRVLAIQSRSSTNLQQDF